MKTIKKIRLKNTLGIEEKEITPKQINIIEGKKGTGKTSILDAINTALSNKNIRADFVRKGETEAIMYVELSDGTIIEREKNLEKSDKIKVIADGYKGQPETYLKSLFSDNQFRPISFIESTEKEQNKTLLGLVNIEWSKDNIKEWFGEIPEWVNYDQHILNILDHIQSQRGEYYLTRENINRDIRNKKAIVADILATLPENYQADKWRNANLSDLYSKVSKAHEFNNAILEKKNFLDSLQDKINTIELNYKEKQEAISEAIKEDINSFKIENDELKKRIEMLQKQILDNTQRIKDAEQSEKQKIELLKVEKQKEIEVLKAKAEAMATKEEAVDVSKIEEEANYAEKMKMYLNEFDNAMSINKEVGDLVADTQILTEKIEKARELPGELLEKFSSPIEGLSVVDGIPLINGLPIKNLSTGEQLELAVKIAIHLAGDLKVILVDRLESLDTESQKIFIEKCKESGCQFFLTRVSDCEYNVLSFD